MAAADLVTLPSYAEGCPNVVLEALASGRPVVATKVGGIPEIMDESVGRLVPPKDVSSLTAALNEVLSQDWNADAIAKRRTRGWSAVADAVEQNLQQIADSFRRNSQQIPT
jgi:glycosyltransferase involved in cell wall biosynthesis